MVGMMEGTLPSSISLPYSVHKWSSYTGDYHPSKVLVDDPTDQNSRWQSACNIPPQYLTLKLDKPAIVRKITFGKFQKNHVCNLRSFTVSAGMSEEGMFEILRKGLTNNSEAETFDVEDSLSGNFFPCQYIRITPVATWGPSAFNFSIWHIKLLGVCDPSYVGPCVEYFSQRRQEKTIKLCLKHLRQHNYSEAFESLQKKSKIQLEHPMLTALHHKLVEVGDYDEAEVLLGRAISEGHMEEYRSRHYCAHWERVVGVEGASRPGPRGGHTMCIDEGAGKVYLFGGWNGRNDLADFWEFCSDINIWHCLSHDTAVNGGPCGRSCHKMVLDTQHKLVYVLGRYMDGEARKESECKSDFYVYDILGDQWNLISSDTASEGGPDLIYDHQMVMDTDRQCIYVFGGKVLSPTRASGASEYSGMFQYHITSNTWVALRPDQDNLLRPRIGHSMLYHPNKRHLYVFAGQRESFLDDFLVYSLDNDTVNHVMCGGEVKVDAPESGVTMRATIDTQLEEIHMLSGLSKDHRNEGKDFSDARTKIYVYNFKTNKWNEVVKPCDSAVEPCPRYAHMFVYDSRTKTHYMFGGNPGGGYHFDRGSDKDKRLDDFWALRINRPAFGEMKRLLQFIVRKYKFMDLSLTDPVGALLYLQQHVEKVVDHSNPGEEQQFHDLVGSVFAGDTTRDTHALRSELFDTLMEYFPDRMSQPKDNLTDYVPPV